MTDQLPLPRVDIWFQIGSRKAQYECAWPEGITVDEALKREASEKGKPTPSEARSFRAGWRAGRVLEATRNLNDLAKHLPVALIDQMADEAQALSKKYGAMLK